MSAWIYWCQGREKLRKAMTTKYWYYCNPTGVRQYARFLRVENNLNKLGYTNKLDILVSYEFKQINLIQRINAFGNLLKREENDSFLRGMITCDEKWIVYNNIQRKRLWCNHDEPTSKQVFTKRRFCCQSDGILKVLYIFIFFQETKRLI